MAQAYLSFLIKFSALNNSVKIKVVTAGFFRKISFLAVLLVLKLTFIVISFPYFLFNGVSPSRTGIDKNNLASVTATPQRLQQVVVLSFAAIALLGAGFVSLFSSVTPKSAVMLHSSAADTLEFSGIRPYDAKSVFTIKDISLSSYQPGVFFNGTGPAFSHAVIFVDDGQSEVGSTKVDGNGEWNFVKPTTVGRFTSGLHSAFAVFYGDDGSILGSPTPVKSFNITTDFFYLVYKTLGLNTIIFGILLFGVLGVSVVRLRKTTTA